MQLAQLLRRLSNHLKYILFSVEVILSKYHKAEEITTEEDADTVSNFSSIIHQID